MTSWHERLTVPRAPFIPSVVWTDDPATDGFVAVTRAEEPERWRKLVDADEPVITQMDDGATAPGAIGLVPSSSCSQPTLVATMLDALDPREGDRVLEVGTGTGWNAALLSDRVGEAGRVVSIEVDPGLAEDARRALANTGHAVTVVVGDGTLGHPAEAPYDGVICTASVRTVPRAWIEQTRPGGVIVTPWGTDYGDDALTRLTVHEDGSASGRCSQSLAFMRVRQQRRDFLAPEATDLAGAESTHTTRGGRELFDIVTFTRAAFTIGLRVPSCYLTVEDVSADRRHVELHDVGSRSWARVAMERGRQAWTVYQYGPRRLWDEVDTAYTWWRDAGEPAPDRYGLTVARDGTHEVWIDERHGPLRWPLPR